jgi:glycine/D-amino acid oxidase-like deaminating enzyme
MTNGETGKSTVAVIGAGIIGCAVAWALCREGRRVLLLDRDAPATAGASFGNVGHIATEQVETLPSKQLLFGFWRDLFAFDGALDIPLRRVVSLSPWIARFIAAAFRQETNTRHLAPLVRNAADSLDHLLGEIGRRDLMRRQGHYAIWFGAGAQDRAARETSNAARLEVRTAPAPSDLLSSSATAAAETTIAGLWFPDSAHVLDPAEVARALASAAAQRGATVQRAIVRQLGPHGDGIEIVTQTERFSVKTAVVCAGVWSPPLLAPFGLRAPLEAERGYHIELPNHPPLADAPLVYADRKVAVTPMAGRLRGSSYLEFAGLDAPPDPRKPARLRAKLRALGYRCELHGPSWMGPRPTLPDYLPGIGRAAGAHNLFYAIGHQHLGLTLAGPTAELIADLVAERTPRFDTTAFDLRRFGTIRGAPRA